MLDAKYYKDLSHNYLIIKNSDDEGKSEYQNRMISGNRIKYLLPCSIRSINNEIYHYYEISSKQNIKFLHERGNLKYEQIYHLFEHIYEASKEVKKYLLEDSNILLQPEYIYANPEGDGIFFVYYPGETIKDMALMSLAEHLLEKVDREDEKAVCVIYKIFEYVQDEKFILPEILRLFNESPINNSNDQDMESKEESMCPLLPEQDAEAYEEGEGVQQDHTEDNEDNIEIKGNMIISAVLLTLCLGAVIAVFCIRYFFILSVEESILTIAGIITLIIVSSFLLLSLIMTPVRVKRKYDNEETDKEDEISAADRYMIVDTYFGEEEGRQSFAEEKKMDKPVYGSTVFIESSLYSLENKLYGTNKGNKYHIDLNKLPCTVGKMAGSVDAVIKDDTVSRIHARFVREGDAVYVTDLNSTNGTFKNGLRLDPNETVQIEAGDEIRFGKMTFCYR